MQGRKLANLNVLVTVREAELATDIVAKLEKAGAEVMITAYAYEARQRLQQFRFDTAVIDGSEGTEELAGLLASVGMPFCVCAQGRKLAWRPPLLVRPENLVVALCMLAAPSAKPPDDRSVVSQ